ncbi:MAG TPA: CPBP family intramembrane glutamic endopeptidase [Thermoanaerobaculia bacterium]|nr:CPBP family intramembrane glutamic endopeptidase [Thermoanaerobaculia bacterium]
MPATTLEAALRLGIPALLAIAVAFFFDRACARRGLTPPGFRSPWRRGLALAFLAGILWRGVFVPVGAIGLDLEVDLSGVSTPQLFLLHGLLILTAVGWFLLGFAGVREEAPLAEPVPAAPTAPVRPGLGRQFLAQFGFAAPNLPAELGLGVVLGVGAWLAVIAAMVLLALGTLAVGGQEALPKAPPTMVPFLAGLPVLVRLLISLSAGVVEEFFFRGFLQPRIGIGLSTALFVLAHFSYGNPFMLVGITVLSLIYALIVRWRQSIWAAIVAHALFDAVQLLVMIPYALRLLETGAGGAAGTPAPGILPGVL